MHRSRNRDLAPSLSIQLIHHGLDDVIEVTFNARSNRRVIDLLRVWFGTLPSLIDTSEPQRNLARSFPCICKGLNLTLAVEFDGELGSLLVKTTKPIPYFKLRRAGDPVLFYWHIVIDKKCLTFSPDHASSRNRDPAPSYR